MRSVRHGGLVLVVSALLFAAVFALRWNASDPVDGVTALYTLPVALLAARFGLRTGLVAGLVAFGLTVTWSLARDAGFGTLAFSSRLLAFLVAGVAVGLIADQVSQSRLERLRLEDEGEAAARRNLRDGQLQALVELLSRAATLEQVAEVYTREGMRLLGAAQGGVFIDNRLIRHRPTTDPAGSPPTVEPGEARADASLFLIAVHRELPGTRDWHTVDLAARTPPTDAARTGTFNYQPDVARIVADYPGLAAIREQSGDQAWAAGPLFGSVGVIGAIAAGYADPQPFDTEQRDLLGKVAARVAEALERASLLEVAGAERARAEASERRASLLADVGAVLAGQWGAAERMQLLLDVLVPALADMGTVELVQSGRLELLVAKHADPARRPALEQLRRLQSGDLPALPNLAQVVRTGQPALGTSISDLVRQWALEADPTSAGLVDDLEVDAFVAVPLRSRGAVIAGLLLMQGGSGRQFGQADLALAELVAGRAALALDNAMLFEQQRDVVTTLQHALLRGDLPLVEGVTATARYRPGMAALDVGGDWYDVVALPDGRVGITLGDVVGRGVAAAATMGQLRTAVAALAPYCSGPAEVLRRLDTFAGAVPGAELATVAYLDFDPATGLLR
jgi:GAF domain-containing protein